MGLLTHKSLTHLWDQETFPWCCIQMKTWNDNEIAGLMCNMQKNLKYQSVAMIDHHVLKRNTKDFFSLIKCFWTNLPSVSIYMKNPNRTAYIPIVVCTTVPATNAVRTDRSIIITGKQTNSVQQKTGMCLVGELTHEMSTI